MSVCGIKVGNIKVFENIGLSPNICKLQKEHGGDDFQQDVQNSFSIKRWEKPDFITFKE